MFPDNQSLIHQFLEESAEAYPDKIALIHEDIRATYGGINARANQLALWLREQGFGRGDRVALILENSLEYVVSYYAVLKIGAVASPLSTDLKPDGLAHLLGDLGPKIVIASSRFERLLKAIDLSPFNIQALLLRSPRMRWSSSPCPVFRWEEVVGQGEASNLDVRIGESNLATIIYTSGSTGKPKGVMLSHRNVVSNTHSICQYLHLTENDIQMVVLPFFYVMGKSLLNTHFAVGGTVVLNNKFAYPASVVKEMVEESVTGFSGVPSTYAYLLHRSPLANYRKRLDSLLYCSQAGGHMSKQIKKELRQILPSHTQIYIMYGATEASARLTYLEPDVFIKKMESIGKPIPGVRIRILDSRGEEVPKGEIGEIVGAGSNIMQGYWQDSEATAEVLDHNGYHTGDLGYQDEEGYLFLVGRRDNLLKVGGHRINPQEVEDVLMATGLILEAAVLGIHDPMLGHRLVALICAKNGNCDENDILAPLASKLPKYKMPSEVKWLRSLPKSPSGKIDRFKCLQIFADRSGGQYKDTEREQRR
jgi:long-chain acyl-CoA synthetase